MVDSAGMVVTSGCALVGTADVNTFGDWTLTGVVVGSGKMVPGDCDFMGVVGWCAPMGVVVN